MTKIQRNLLVIKASSLKNYEFTINTKNNSYLTDCKKIRMLDNMVIKFKRNTTDEIISVLLKDCQITSEILTDDSLTDYLLNSCSIFQE